MRSSPGITLGIGLALVLVLVLCWSVVGDAIAQVAAPKAASAASKPVTADVLEGAWVRPDGGYLILIKKASADGRLEASYFNPKPLPFAKAHFVRDGGTLRLSFVLEAGGYAGSTYELTYDAAADQLKGVYYQAVMKQKFDVQFARK
jgi:hypothetical protein